MILSVLVFVLYGFDVIDEGSMLIWSYILIFIAAATSILFPIGYFIANPKKAKTALIGIGAFVILGGIAYVMAEDTIPTFLGAEAFEIDHSSSKNISTSLITTYLLSAVTLGVILYAEIAKYFK
ncbi:MAG TPA: hypothetical protein DDX39_00100 [Bacteroidales bacterium]|nr:MAG: hypothetical protein A2W98_04060 [Bacteroidetes bacterium GWF2_33_38]HBF87010.1 hypothetical protein [Bacteroidales bacterium]